MLLTELRADTRNSWRVVEFNPWNYPDADAMQRGFFSELMNVFPKGLVKGRTRKKIGKLANAVSPFGSLGVLVGLNAQPILKSFSTMVAGDTTVTATHKQAAEALSAMETPIIMVIDDLDRLTPDELLEVLKFVRLIGRLPNVYYLLCYDQQTLIETLARTDLVSGPDRAVDYLEKIVQVRVDMPVLRSSQRLELLNKGLETILSRTGRELSPSEAARLSDIYETTLERHLSTPRSINHYLGQVQAFLPTMIGSVGKAGEVDVVDFLLVTWVRINQPGVYRLLQERRQLFIGDTFDALSISNPEAAATARREKWRSTLQGAVTSEESLEAAIEILAMLFPKARNVLKDASMASAIQQRKHRRAISNPDYYERYLTFGVPEDDVADSLVEKALRAIGSGEETAEKHRLVDELKHHTARMVEKIEALASDGFPMPHAALYSLAVNVFDQVDSDQGAFTNPRRLLLGVGADALANLSNDDRSELIARSAHSDGLIRFTADAIRLLAKRVDHPLEGPRSLALEDVELAKTQIAAVLDARFGDVDAPASLPLTATESYLFRTWLEFDEKRAGNWLAASVASGGWSLIEVLPAFVSSATVTGSDGSQDAIGHFDLDSLIKVFGEARLQDELDIEIQNAPDYMDSWSTDPTLENRLSYALSVLKGRRGEPG
jgi:hypothetical protein